MFLHETKINVHLGLVLRINISKSSEAKLTSCFPLTAFDEMTQATNVC